MLKLDAKVKPYEFETLGEALGLVARKKKEEKPEAPPAPTFSEEELQQKTQESYQQGLSEGIAKGRTEAEDKNRAINEQLTKVLEGALGKIQTLEAHYTQNITALRQQMPALVVAASRKVAGQALKEEPLAKIEETLAKIFPILAQKPEVAVHVHPSLAEVLKEKLQTIATEKNMETKFTVLADEATPPADIRFEWKDGGVATNTGKMWEDIEKMLEECL